MDRDPLMQFFAYAHLPEHLQVVSKPFSDLAAHVHDTLPRNPERTVALRKLLEAKDCAVRALIWAYPSVLTEDVAVQKQSER
jgi:ferritin-like protein